MESWKNKELTVYNKVNENKIEVFLLFLNYNHLYKKKILIYALFLLKIYNIVKMFYYLYL